MKKFAGVAQPVERRGVSHSDVAFGSNPAPRSILQALVAGLQQDPATRRLGLADGAAGLWRLSVEEIVDGEIDVLAYASGWAEGARHHRKHHGG